MSAEVGVVWGAAYVAADHAAHAMATTRRAGVATCHEDTPELAASVADALINLSFKTWDFGDSVAFEALIAASEVLGDERWARFAQGYGRAWATRAKPYVRLDCTVPGRALVGLSVCYNDSQLLAALRGLADYLVTRPLMDGVYATWVASPLLAPYSGVELDEHSQRLLENSPAGVYLDCLHFDPPFLTALGVATGEAHYVVAGVEQALGYVRMLQTKDGLFDHFVLLGEPHSFGPGWGRGQGWAILGLLETIESIDEFSGVLPDGARATLADSASRLLRAMLATQRADGHWPVVVTEPDSGDEFSTAGFMAWAIWRALKLGVVEGDAMVEAMRAARGAILNSLDAQAQLREVSAAVYSSTEPSHYAHVPRGLVVPWGQGPALLALLAGGWS